MTDKFASNILNNIGSVTGFDMALAVILSFGIGIYILLVYRRISFGAMYSENFGICLVPLCMITATLILAVSSNILLSLGMLGALSIVRYRAAIKEPMEMVFLFWSIEAGIVLAAGIIPLAVGINVAIGILLLLWVKRRKGAELYMLVIRCDSRRLYDEGDVPGVLSFVNRSVQRCTVKSRLSENRPPESSPPEDSQMETGEVSTVVLDDSGAEIKPQPRRRSGPAGARMVELDLEVVLRPAKRDRRGGFSAADDRTAFVDELLAMQGVESASLVAYNGAYMEGEKGHVAE